MMPNDSEDIYWIVIDDLSDYPNIWAICDGCSGEKQITSKIPADCQIYQDFIAAHMKCKK
jgi:hypothetical protein